MTTKTAVFLDRDGTINEEVGYLDDLGKLKLYDFAPQAVKRINEAGMMAVIITNQSGVARGFYTEDFLRRAHKRLLEMLKEKGAAIDAVYYCPHHPQEGEEPYRMVCGCRKPEPGMLIRAAEDLQIDLSRSYVVGDHASDMEAARRVSAKGVLVRTGHGWEYPEDADRPDHMAENVLDAVKWIMKDRPS